MNTDKIKKALAIIQEAIDETPHVVLHLELNAREAKLLNYICMVDVSVPAAVVKSLPLHFDKDTYDAKGEMTDLLNKIQRAL